MMVIKVAVTVVIVIMMLAFMFALVAMKNGQDSEQYKHTYILTVVMQIVYLLSLLAIWI